MDGDIGNFCLGIQGWKSGDQRDATWYNITATAALLYGLLTILVNVRVYVVILKNRKKNEFSSSFYVVFIIATIVVLLTPLICLILSVRNSTKFFPSPQLHQNLFQSTHLCERSRSSIISWEYPLPYDHAWLPPKKGCFRLEHIQGWKRISTLWYTFHSSYWAKTNGI
jgi:hypothetical protein